MSGEKKEALKRIIQVVYDASGGAPIYIIGGVVRDLLCGEGEFADYDIDFTVEGESGEIVRRVQNSLGGKVKTFPQFFTSKIQGILLPISELDFAETRAETYKQPGALPTVVKASFDEDIKRRDFTINTLALSLPGFEAVLNGEPPKKHVIDKFEGIKDLEAKIVRILHARSFEDDPTRIFRAARYAARLSGDLSEDTKESLKNSIKAGALLTISGQRKWNEIKKVFSESKPSSSLEILLNWGVFNAMGIIEKDNLRSLILSLKTKEDKNQLTFEGGVAAFYGSLNRDSKNAFEKESGFGKKVIMKLQGLLENERRAAT